MIIIIEQRGSDMHFQGRPTLCDLLASWHHCNWVLLGGHVLLSLVRGLFEAVGLVGLSLLCGLRSALLWTSSICFYTLRKPVILLRKTKTRGLLHKWILIRGFVICEKLRNFHNKQKFAFVIKIFKAVGLVGLSLLFSVACALLCSELHPSAFTHSENQWFY